MPSSFTNLLYHFVFSTKDRESLITSERRPRLYEYMGGTIRSLGGISLEINGMSDHVHLLSKLRPDESVSNAIRSLKANASGWMHKVFPELSDFKWQDGYGGFTVSQSQVEQVRKYIRLQEHHHQKRSFKDEFTELLKINGIEFNEEHLWK